MGWHGRRSARDSSGGDHSGDAASIEESRDVKETWFEGCHSDVGGGLPENEGSLYKHSLEWMVREAHDKGLFIDEHALDGLLSEAAGPPRKVESLKTAWHLAELAPRLHLLNPEQTLPGPA